MKYPFPPIAEFQLGKLAQNDQFARDVCNTQELLRLQMFLVETYAASPLTRKGRMARLRQSIQAWLVELRDHPSTRARYAHTRVPARYTDIDSVARCLARECMFRRTLLDTWRL